MEKVSSGTRSRLRPESTRDAEEVRHEIVPPCDGLGGVFYGPYESGPGGVYESRGDREAREAYAKSICETCPLKEPCLAFALNEDEEWGIWGGTTEGERRFFRDQLRKMGFDDLPVGQILELSISAIFTNMAWPGPKPAVLGHRALTDRVGNGRVPTPVPKSENRKPRPAHPRRRAG